MLLMNSKDVFANENKLYLVKSLYILLFIFYLIVFVFLFLTNGSISFFIKNNIIYAMIPLLMPIILSLVGLNDYKIESNSEYIKIYSNCILMGMFYDTFKKKVIINIKEPFENKISKSHFGLRKSLIIRQIVNNKLVKSKINISLLSNNELELLQQKLKK